MNLQLLTPSHLAHRCFHLTSSHSFSHDPIQHALMRQQPPRLIPTIPRASVSTLETPEESVSARELNGAVRMREKELLSAGDVAGDVPGRRGVLKSGRLRQRSVHDYMELVPEFIRPDGGPPRWFCPLVCSRPPPDAPLLLFLPGMDGTGLGLILHEELLGKLFEVRCLHVPVKDRTPFEGLVILVEQTLQSEYSINKARPIYMVGDSLGGALALSVAARNNHMDLILLLSNPATSFNRSQLQPLFPLIHMVPSELYNTVPYLLSFVMGDPVLMAMARAENASPPLEKLQQLRDSLVALLPTLTTLADVIPKDALVWKLKLLQSAALYTNSRLHAVKAEVLILASGKDQMLPSVEEARSLKKSLKNCRVRNFYNNGHTLLLENGFQLATLIKGFGLYRHSKTFDCVKDFVPPTLEEFDQAEEQLRFSQWWISPVFFSTLKNGKVTRGLSGVPEEGPVLLVGNHILMGIESNTLVREFLKQRNQLIRGAAHPFLFMEDSERVTESVSGLLRLFGAVPVSGKNLFKLLSQKEFILLYPGGAREGCHRKGEEHTLFWPKKSEFVRMAARFDATIVPFSVVGEDDLLELLFDYEDFKKVPFLEYFLDRAEASVPKLRSEDDGEVANQPPHVPVIAPKLGGRLYILFGKPFTTTERKLELQNRDKANELYLEVKKEVQAGIEYLQKKRKEDPYKDLLLRCLYEISWGENHQVPTFQP